MKWPYSQIKIYAAKGNHFSFIGIWFPTIDGGYKEWLFDSLGM